MRIKNNSRDREWGACSGGNDYRSQHLLAVALRHLRAYFSTGLTPQLVPVKIEHIHNNCLVNKKKD